MTQILKLSSSLSQSLRFHCDSDRGHRLLKITKHLVVTNSGSNMSGDNNAKVCNFLTKTWKKKRPFCKHRCCCRYFCAVAQIRCQSAVVADVWLCQIWLDPNSLLIPNSFYTFLLAFNYSATLRLSRQLTPITTAKVMSTSLAQRKEQANCGHNLLRWCQCGVEPIQTKAKAKQNRRFSP